MTFVVCLVGLVWLFGHVLGFHPRGLLEDLSMLLAMGLSLTAAVRVASGLTESRVEPTVEARAASSDGWDPSDAPRAKRIWDTVLFFAAGLALVGTGLFMGATPLRLALSGRRTTGVVQYLDQRVSGVSDRETTTYWVGLSYYDGKEQRTTQAQASDQLYESVGEGQAIPIVCDGAKAYPVDDLWSFHFSDALVVLGLGVGLLSWGWIGGGRRKKRRRRGAT